MAITSYIDTFSSILIFEVSNNEFCIHINELLAVLDFSENNFHIDNTTKTPRLIFKEKVFPLIDLSAYLKLENKDFDKESRVLLIQNASGIAAIRVNKVKEILNIDKHILDRLDKDIQNEFLQGKLDYDDNNYVFPDFNEILENNLLLVK